MTSPTPLQSMLLDGMLTPTASDSEEETADMKTVARTHDGYAESVGGYAESEGNAFPETGEASAMTNERKQRESETGNGSCPEPKDDD
eukprot:3270797-Karenia_brevis.AAC.1